jgi:DNA repair exonuclease SbcCD nuclease subunit
MTFSFIHTADWQLGKPFAGVEDPQKRSSLQNERLNVLKRMASAAKDHGAGCVLVAGDLFDSPSATKGTVSAACSAIGAMGVPVYAIPGNHDHGGPGSLWEQAFFRHERDQLAPNFHILLKREPIELEHAVLLPCPLLRRHEPADPTEWLRSSGEWDARYGNKPRIVLAHGSVQSFGSISDDEEEAGASNLIDLDRLPADAYDYIALGDWHGTKQVGARAWYAGTPELDRFVKGDNHDPGNILVTEVCRGQIPKVQSVRTGAIGWHEIEFCFADDSGLGHLKKLVEEKVGTRAGQDLLRLDVAGSLGIEASTQLEQIIDVWHARLLRVKLRNQTAIAPTAEELSELTSRVGDPLISRVAAKLIARTSGDPEQASVARIALRELHAACHSN